MQDRGSMVFVNKPGEPQPQRRCVIDYRARIRQAVVASCACLFVNKKDSLR
jgi:hypothetical protein